jgi:outer membrane protein OmpA-like peptidoglycan-associated protein
LLAISGNGGFMRSEAIVLGCAIAFGAIVAACSSTPAPNPDLDAAQTLYNQASNDPAVVKDAPLELQQSREALSQAQAQWRNNGDPVTVGHFAYLAARRAELAQQTAKLKEAQLQISNADAARAQALLAARTQEATQARQQAQQAQSEASHLQQQLAALKADQANAGAILTLRDILFDVNGTDLKPGSYDSIRQIANFLKEHPERTVVIEGFTDSTGGADYNLRLSQLRAEAVRNALVREGVAPDHVVARGMGASEPVASNDTVAGRQLNRRVQVAISNVSGRMPSEPPALSGGSRTQ